MVQTWKRRWGGSWFDPLNRRRRRASGTWHGTPKPNRCRVCFLHDVEVARVTWLNGRRDMTRWPHYPRDHRFPQPHPLTSAMKAKRRRRW